MMHTVKKQEKIIKRIKRITPKRQRHTHSLMDSLLLRPQRGLVLPIVLQQETLPSVVKN